MNDLNTLHDAFGEYERRADAMSARPTDTGSHRRTRGPLLVAASVVAVAGIATGAVLIGRGSSSPSHHGQAVGQPSVTSQASTSPRSTPVIVTVTPTRTTLAPSKHATAKHVTPKADYRSDFEAAFKRVLGDSATFTVTYSDTGVLGGVLTTADGVSGGYDIQYFDGAKGDAATCPDLDLAKCTVKDLAGGGQVAYIHDPLQNSGNFTNIVEYVRPDGTHFIMSSSNERDPKGESAKLADAPPYTADQIIAILTSDKW